MSDLDTSSMFKYDSDKMIDQIENFSKDCRNAWEQCQELILPSFYVKPKKIVLIGMGGSGIANDMIADLLFDSPVSITSIHGYDIPGFVDENTLVIANSYSGNTEEVLSGFITAYKKDAKLIAISTGGKLETLAEKYKIPLLKFNYLSTPRMALPYNIMSLLAIFSKLGHYKMDESIDDIMEKVDRITQNYRHEITISQNGAKSLAQKLEGKIPVIYSSFKLKSIGYRFKCQINENSKSFSFSEFFPELNHNAIQGYKFPKAPVAVVSLESVFDDSQTAKRQNLTAELLQKFGIRCERIKYSQVNNPLVEFLSHIQFSNYVSYYLSVIYGIDPTGNPDISLFKTKL